MRGGAYRWSNRSVKEKDGLSAGCPIRRVILVIWLLLLKQKRMRFKPIKSRLFRWTSGQEQ